MAKSSNTIHVFDFLEGSQAAESGVCVLFGAKRFLKQLAIHSLTEGGNEYSVNRLDGATAEFAEVMDELATQSLFGGGGSKTVLVDDADKFVQQNRDRLEAVIENPGSNRLILVVDSWAANTRLYKLVNKHGFQIRCDAPTTSSRSKNPDKRRICSWLVQRAEVTHDFKLPAKGASLLLDLCDGEFGRMDQELQKLALYAEKGKVTVDQVASVVGGWRTRTMWDAIAAACDGDCGEALRLLDQLLKSGEHPLALFGQLSWSLRRYSLATEIVLRQVRQGKRPDLSSAIGAAGFRPWGGEVDAAGSQLKQLGRGRAAQILDWLNETDAALKRTHTTASRGRLALEKLFIRMSRELAG